MALLDSMRNKIESKIFDRLGSTATRHPFNSQSVDKWGDATKSYDGSESVTVVPYNYVSERTEFEVFGDVQKGDLLMAFKYDQDLGEKDKVVYDTKTLFVREIEDFPLSDGVVIKVVRLVESLN